MPSSAFAFLDKILQCGENFSNYQPFLASCLKKKLFNLLQPDTGDLFPPDTVTSAKPY